MPVVHSFAHWFISFSDNCKPEDIKVYPFQSGAAPTPANWPAQVSGVNTPKLNTVLEDWFQYSVMNELREDPAENALIIIANEPNWTKAQKTNVATLLFGMEWQGISFVPASVCCLHAIGSDSGLVIDIGASGFRVNAVAGNHIEASTVSNAGGAFLSKFVAKEQWWTEASALDALFKPSLGGSTDQGLAVAVASVLDKCKPVSCVLLCGGCSAAPGLHERLERELSAAGKSLKTAKTHVQPNRNLAFQGCTKILQSQPFEAAYPGDLQYLELPL